MIKTLRITSVIAAVLATFFVVFPAVFGVSRNEQIEDFLNSAGAIEKFRLAKGTGRTNSKSQSCPLVEQARAFALYLNPPKAEKRQTVRKKASTPQATPRPKEVSPKFTLKGTSYYAMHPEMSLALIDEPGKGLRWVRQSSKVGHLVIEQVKDGLVVVRDGKRAEELIAERPSRKSLIKDAASSQTGSKATPSISSTSKVSPPSKPSDKVGESIKRRLHPPMSDEESALMDRLIDRLKAAQRTAKSDKDDSGDGTEENSTLMDKVLSDFQGARISDKEVKRLGNLGKKLKDIQRDPNQVKQRKSNQAEDRKAKRLKSSRTPAKNKK